MARESKALADCRAQLGRTEAQLHASQAWVSASFRGMVPKQYLLQMAEGNWVAHVVNPSAAHGGIVVVTNEEGSFVCEPTQLDALCSNWLHTTDCYLRQHARDLLRFRESLLASK